MSDVMYKGNGMNVYWTWTGPDESSVRGLQLIQVTDRGDHDGAVGLVAYLQDGVGRACLAPNELWVDMILSILRALNVKGDETLHGASGSVRVRMDDDSVYLTVPRGKS